MFSVKERSPHSHKTNSENNLRIALVNPRSESYTRILLTLGLLYIAAVLEKDGFKVRIFDLYPDDDRDCPSLIAFDPHIVGMSILTDYAPRAQHVSKTISKELPQSVFITKGVHVTALPEGSNEGFNADFAVTGEGEDVMLDICRKISKGRDIDLKKRRLDRAPP